MELTKDWLLNHIEDMSLTYETVEEYGRDTFADGANYSKEDFQDDMENGFIVELTLGTYNGATKTFQTRKMDKYHIYDALWIYLTESDFVDIEYAFEDYEDPSEAQLVHVLVDKYTIIVIGDRVFIDRN